MAPTPPGYHIRKTYVVICDKCNEDITRPISGGDITSREDALDLISDHEKVWHESPDS